MLEQAPAQLCTAGFSVSTAMLEGPVIDALFEYQKTQAIDLTIMGAYGHSRIRQFFVGSHTSRLLANSMTSLLLLR